MNLILPNKNYTVDEEGWLEDLSEWDEYFAIFCAKQDNIELNDKFWSVIYFFREYYEEYQTPPRDTIIIKEMRKRWKIKQLIDVKSLCESIFLYGKVGMYWTISKYAGTPKPTC